MLVIGAPSFSFTREAQRAPKPFSPLPLPLVGYAPVARR